MIAEKPWKSSVPVEIPPAPGERRSSARVPLTAPVRIGPPGGLPYAAVSARDLSAGGLFVDAERNVRVGARFSVEVPLTNGQRVYVSEAEVIDNRRRGDARGFGARFVVLSSEGRRLLEEEVCERASVTLRPSAGRRDAPERSALEAPVGGLAGDDPPSPVPSPSSEGFSFSPDSRREDTDPSLFGDPSEVDVPDLPTLSPELPSLDDSSLEDSSAPLGRELSRASSSDPELAQGARAGSVTSGPTLRVRARTRWSRMKAWLRSFPAISAALYATAALALVVVGLAVLWDPPGPRSAPVLDTQRTVTDEIHERLVDEADPAGLIEPPALVRAGGIVNRLPDKDLPAVDSQARAHGGARSAVVEGTPAREGDEPRVPRPLQTEDPMKRRSAGATSRTSVAKDARASAQVPEPKSPARSAAGSSTQTASGRVVIEISPGARLKAQYVLRSPDRFVVDVVGLKGVPQLPSGEGKVRRVRFGRHDGFSRFVVDSDGPVSKGRASISRGRLEIHLSFK